MISNLVDDSLLRAVRLEIITKISFTLKETDIYKIHQSGDLANLDGLDNQSLAELPSLLKLRNAMYSELFRDYLSAITGAGPLSGRKTDMAINIYKPGCHLLCHDDVIGSRRVSYILYLTDPDNPWKATWGGALRLYPTKSCKNKKRQSVQVPDPDFTVSIPPAWNQLSFFAVQPGESFHDVEEVYSAGDDTADAQRERIAISGWYHIPQEGESGYEEGLEEKLAETSSLTQLQTKDEFDQPKPNPTPYPEYSQPPRKAVPEHFEDESESDPEPEQLTMAELDFLLKFVAPNLLVPSAVAGIWKEFTDASFIRIDNFLSPDFAGKLKDALLANEDTIPRSTKEIDAVDFYKVARPPHKHRYLYVEPGTWEPNQQNLLSVKTPPTSPIKLLLSQYLPSREFRKWLRLATSLVLKSHDMRARRFRRGVDYQLATAYEDEDPRLELCLGITPKGNFESQTAAAQTEEGTEPASDTGKAKSEAQSPTEKDKPVPKDEEEESYLNGGYESYMAGDDEKGTVVAEEAPTAEASSDSTKAKPKSRTNPSDPAIYQSAPDTDDDPTLFTMAAGWNRLSLVLRDKGTLRFVKYVSKAAGADRWDVVGEFDVDWEKTPDFGVGEEELEMELEEEEDDGKGVGELGSSEEETSLDEAWGGLSSEDEEGPVKSQEVGKTATFGRRRK